MPLRQRSRLVLSILLMLVWLAGPPLAEGVDGSPTPGSAPQPPAKRDPIQRHIDEGMRKWVEERMKADLQREKDKLKAQESDRAKAEEQAKQDKEKEAAAFERKYGAIPTEWSAAAEAMLADWSHLPGIGSRGEYVGGPPIAGDKTGTQSGASAANKPSPAADEPKMVPVSTDERKALTWYVWYLQEKLKRHEAAAKANPEIDAPDKKGKTRSEKLKDKLAKAEGRLKNMGGEGIGDPDMVQDIQKAQADHQQAKAAAAGAK